MAGAAQRRKVTLPASHPGRNNSEAIILGTVFVVRMPPQLPTASGSTIVVFALALVAGRCFDFAGMNMAVIGAVDTHIPTPVPPELSLADIGRLVTAALGLALLSFLADDILRLLQFFPFALRDENFATPSSGVALTMP
jgi:hypothetical protein